MTVHQKAVSTSINLNREPMTNFDWWVKPQITNTAIHKRQKVPIIFFIDWIQQLLLRDFLKSHFSTSEKWCIIWNARYKLLYYFLIFRNQIILYIENISWNQWLVFRVVSKSHFETGEKCWYFPWKDWNKINMLISLFWNQIVPYIQCICFMK